MSHMWAAHDGPEQFEATDDREVESHDATQYLLALDHRHARPVQEAPAQRVLGLARTSLHCPQEMSLASGVRTEVQEA